MYQSIPAVNIPQAALGNFLKGQNSQILQGKKAAKPQPPMQKILSKKAIKPDPGANQEASYGKYGLICGTRASAGHRK